MTKNLSCPRAYVSNTGNLICLLEGQFIYINAKGEYVPAKHEEEKLVPINNVEWSFAKSWGKDPIALTPKQINQVRKALIKREKFFIAKKSITNFIDPKELHDLVKLSPNDLYAKIMSWFKHFIRTEKNQHFRDKVGAVIFNGPVFLISRLSSCQREEALLAFKIFNPTPDKKLEKQIKWVKSNTQQIRLSRLNTFAEGVKGINHLEKVS